MYPPRAQAFHDTSDRVSLRKRWIISWKVPFWIPSNPKKCPGWWKCMTESEKASIRCSSNGQKPNYTDLFSLEISQFGHGKRKRGRHTPSAEPFSISGRWSQIRAQAQEGMREAAPADRKPACLSPSVHQNGRASFWTAVPFCAESRFVCVIPLIEQGLMSGVWLQRVGLLFPAKKILKSFKIYID